MLLYVHSFTKFYSKIENHHHHHPGPEDSLESFRSHLSISITQLLVPLCNLKPGFEIAWIHQCFQLIPLANKAFAKLVVDIDYHMTNWQQPKPMQDYLNYSLELLDHFNSISASISHLGHARLSLLHALTSPSSAPEKMKAITFHSPPRKEIGPKQSTQGEKHICCSDKESVILQALTELRSIGFWVCRVVLAILSGDETMYTKSKQELSNPALVNLDSRVAEIVSKKGCFLNEVKQLQDSSAGALERELGEFEKQLNDIGKEVDRVFSQILAARNELLNGIRFTK